MTFRSKLRWRPELVKPPGGDKIFQFIRHGARPEKERQPVRPPLKRIEPSTAP